MSQENVEVRNDAVGKFFSTFNSDGETDAFRSILHPGIEWFPVEENRVPTRGIEATMRYRDRWLDIWDEHRFDVEEVIEDGDDIVARVHIMARGRASGAEVDIRFYAQFTVQDGKIARIYDHDSRSEALKAAGLSE